MIAMAGGVHPSGGGSHLGGYPKNPTGKARKVSRERDHSVLGNVSCVSFGKIKAKKCVGSIVSFSCKRRLQTVTEEFKVTGQTGWTNARMDFHSFPDRNCVIVLIFVIVKCFCYKSIKYCLWNSICNTSAVVAGDIGSSSCPGNLVFPCPGQVGRLHYPATDTL